MGWHTASTHEMFSLHNYIHSVCVCVCVCVPWLSYCPACTHRPSPRLDALDYWTSCWPAPAQGENRTSQSDNDTTIFPHALTQQLHVRRPTQLLGDMVRPRVNWSSGTCLPVKPDHLLKVNLLLLVIIVDLYKGCVLRHDSTPGCACKPNHAS